METATLDDVLCISRQLSKTDQLRLIALLSDRLRTEIELGGTPVDILSLAGLGAELWQQIDIDAYLEQERNSWED